MTEPYDRYMPRKQPQVPPLRSFYLTLGLNRTISGFFCQTMKLF